MPGRGSVGSRVVSVLWTHMPPTALLSLHMQRTLQHKSLWGWVEALGRLFLLAAPLSPMGTYAEAPSFRMGSYRTSDQVRSRNWYGPRRWRWCGVFLRGPLLRGCWTVSSLPLQRWHQQTPMAKCCTISCFATVSRSGRQPMPWKRS